MTTQLEMNPEEFDELLRKLHRLSLNDGDLGYMYWSKAIKELQSMRAICNAQTEDSNKGINK